MCAQDISKAPLTWSVNKLNDLNSQATVPYSCTFQTNGMDPIVWDQSSEDFTLTINRIDGNWNNIKVSGAIVYHVNLDGTTGTLKFERSNSGTFITLELPQERIKHRYSVLRVTPK